MSLADQLPPSLNLPPHLSAHKYFFVCTLTVAAWDTLVLSPRAWKLIKTDGWPILKVIFNFLRLFMPAEFIVVGMCTSMNYDPQLECSPMITSRWFLWHPMDSSCTLAPALLLLIFLTRSLPDLPKVLPIRTHMHCNLTRCDLRWTLLCFFFAICCQSSHPLAVHVIRIHAIYDKSRAVLLGLGALYAVQIVVTAICCAFYWCEYLCTAAFVSYPEI